ncbi:hypothetical protein EDD55_10656 [Varunaivibrio sulfuroxidans]|uniref:Transmembrane protein n=2 Tax=Varunaivibrio sulfuroxidans TaxID=1773489 RepID=A0A4V2UNH5_9PROT|nr:hypothetical protein EDD55_10656 [Varunaivibrio sulfuroxidans]
MVHVYATNRRWVAARMAAPRARALMKGAIAVTMVVWIVIWLVAGERQRARLTEAMKSFWAPPTQSIETDTSK